jgi:hypothetical protein
MPSLYTYRDPVLSLWQSAVAEVQQRSQSVQAKMATATSNRIAQRARPASETLMSPVEMIGGPLAEDQPVAEEISTLPAATAIASKSVVTTPIDCVKLAAQFLWAEITRNTAKSQILAGELQKSVCDVGWGECVTTYLAYKASAGNLLYRPNVPTEVDLGTRRKLAIIGDWGTGDEVAINVLQQVAALKPDVLIHLGDIYYAGTPNEAKSNFLDICREILGNQVMLVSLCGNHDMYSGGAGYYGLLDQIGQKASYFCLQNESWQFLAMDTGHNDNNPVTVATNMTSLMTVDDWSEAAWISGKIKTPGNRRTVLLSHHQLFSPFGSVGTTNGQKFGYNPNLFADFKDVLPQVEWWFWGHEHTLAIYDPYMTLRRGRCIGASAVPVFVSQQKYANADGLTTWQPGAPPTWNKNCQLGDNGTDYAHAFAIMTLGGSSANVDYYQVPVLGTASKFAFSDTA